MGIYTIAETEGQNMTLSNPTQEEIVELFNEYHALLQDLSAAYRRVNEIGVNWETQYEVYSDERGLISPEWY